jgi:hypothetical protein
MIHALFCSLFFQCFTGKQGIPSRYLLAASHHANKAITLSQSIPSPLSGEGERRHYASVVMQFGFTCFDDLVNVRPELGFWYPEMKKAIDGAIPPRRKQGKQVKRLEKPNWYRCANLGCTTGIIGDEEHGKMLPKCEYSSTRLCSVSKLRSLSFVLNTPLC